jgi:hypothetical protein
MRQQGLCSLIQGKGSASIDTQNFCAWRFALRVAGLTFTFSLVACSTINQPSVTSWREAVGVSKEQSRATFDAVKALVRESQLDFLEKSDPNVKKKLTEEDLAAGLPSPALRNWNMALDGLAAYAASVESLLSPDLPRQRRGHGVVTGPQGQNLEWA